MSTDNVFGWRRDVAEALKALKPGIIRFGGSTTEGFEWTDTIGDPARRVPFTTVWGGLEPGNAGLEEFVQLCRWVGAEPLICIRFSGRTPQQAAEQVQYFNGPADSPMGKRRAASGHAAPYGVKYWQVGNELGDEAYQKGLASFCKAMKAVDPGIKLMAAFPSPGLLQKAGPWIDYICPHHYGCQNLAAMEEDVAQCRRQIAENAPGRPIRLGITEWNTTAGDWGLGRAMLWTLDNALLCSRYHNFMHRHCDTIEIANRSNLTDSFCSGIIQTNGTGLFKTPTYYAQQLYATHAGQKPLKIRVDAELPSDPALDTSATLSDDGRTVALFVVNSTNQAWSRTVDLSAFAPLDPNVQVWTLADTTGAGERDAANDWRQPDRIRVEASKTVIGWREARPSLPAALARGAESPANGKGREGHDAFGRASWIHRLHREPAPGTVRVQRGHGLLLRGLAARRPAARRFSDRPGQRLDHAGQLGQQGPPPCPRGDAGPEVAGARADLGERVPDRGRRAGLLGRQSLPLRSAEVQHERHAAVLRLRSRLAGLVVLLQQRGAARSSTGYRPTEQSAPDPARCPALPGKPQRRVPGLHLDGPAVHRRHRHRPADRRPELDLLSEHGQLQGTDRLLHT